MVLYKHWFAVVQDEVRGDHVLEAFRLLRKSIVNVETGDVDLGAFENEGADIPISTGAFGDAYDSDGMEDGDGDQGNNSDNDDHNDGNDGPGNGGADDSRPDDGSDGGAGQDVGGAPNSKPTSESDTAEDKSTTGKAADDQNAESTGTETAEPGEEAAAKQRKRSKKKKKKKKPKQKLKLSFEDYEQIKRMLVHMLREETDMGSLPQHELMNRCAALDSCLGKWRTCCCWLG